MVPNLGWFDLMIFLNPHLRTFSFAVLERGRERERNADVREALIGCLRTHADRGSAPDRDRKRPDWELHMPVPGMGMNSHSGYVPQPGIIPATFRLQDDAPTTEPYGPGLTMIF